MIVPIRLQSLVFRRVRALVRDDASRHIKYLRVGMPRIPQHVIRSVFYLYENVDDAKAGRNPGGTGFFVGWYGKDVYHLYAVTNWHVAVDDSDIDHPPCRVIKYTQSDGAATHIMNLSKDDWFFIPGHSDLAVAPVDYSDDHKIVAVPADMFVRDIDSYREIDVGDDVFMMGLFADHDGGTKVSPAARFGNISVMPDKESPIEQDNAGRAEAFILDIHSRSGFSGAPAFVYRTFGSDLSFDPEFDVSVRIDPSGYDEPSIRVEPKMHTLFKFLGVHYAQFPEEWEIGKKRRTESTGPKLISDSEYVEGFSGMTCVVPAWKLIELLNSDDLVELRKQEEARVAAESKKNKPKPERTSGKRGDTQELSGAEVVARRDAAVRRALATPPKPLKEMKAGKRG